MRPTALLPMPVCAAVLLAVSSARGQEPADGEPRVITPRVDLEGLQIEEIYGALELEWRLDLDQVELPQGGGRRTKQNRLREILELGTEAYIGHPNLVELDLWGRLWLEQRWLDTTGNPQQRIDQTLYEWDASALLIQNSDTPLTIYSRQNVSDIDREFGGTLENTFRETGARLDIRNETFPTSIQVFRREIEQEDLAFQNDFNIVRDSVLADGRVDLGPTQRLAWDFEYSDIDESGQVRPTRSVERIEGNSTYSMEFGDDQQHSFRNRIRIYDESGDRELRQVQVDPRLRFRHTDTLRSWYDYSYTRNDRAGQDQRSHRATANVQHELFDSLTTIASAGYEYFEIPTSQFDSEEIFGRVNTEYRKQVPGGRLLATVQVDYSHEDRSDLGTPVAVPDRLFVFDAANLVVINGRNIIPSSVSVTDATGIFVYAENFDYILRSFPDRIEIQRLAGGNIAPGQAVLVEYVIGPEPGGTTDTTGVGFSARYVLEEGALRGLSAYVQYRKQNETRDPRREDFLENDFDELRYGVEFNRGPLFLLGERQSRSGTLAAFEVIRFEGRFVQGLGPGSNIVLSGLFQEIDREFDDLRTSITTLTGQWNQRFSENFDLALIVQYQWTDDSQNFESEAFEQQLDLTWRRGRTEAYAQIRNSMRDSNVNDTTIQRFIVGLRREF